MVKILPDISRTFSEYLLVPGLTRKDNISDRVTTTTPVSKFQKGETPRLSMNIPMTSACMQAVSGQEMAIALARQGGLSFVFCSQPIDSQVNMIQQVKSHKAGFVTSDTNVKPGTKLSELVDLIDRTGHSTVPVTEDGSSTGKFLGIVTDKDFWVLEDDPGSPVSQYMTPKEDVFFGDIGITLREANQMLRTHKKECLPILDDKGNLSALVFKKDYLDHMQYPLEVLDPSKRLAVGAAINTHDYRERVPALVEAGADVLCFDSSDGYSEFQRDAALWIREQYGDKIILGGGNIVSSDGFDYLVKEAQLDFVKVGIGGGSICITREQKGIGRGQASAMLDVVAARNRYLEETGTYIPVCSDGGLANDTQIIIALAMGADFVMMGRYFAMTDESPTPKMSIRGRAYKPYWGEGSSRARNWQRYSDSRKSNKMTFEEGVDAYVPLVGTVGEVLGVTMDKLKSTMCNSGANTLQDFQEGAVLTLVSSQSVVEGGTSNVEVFEISSGMDQ